MFKFTNEVRIVVREGDSGAIVHDSQQHNDISDDFTCGRDVILMNHVSNTAQPYCFLLPDDAGSPPSTEWSGFVFDRVDPWAPFATQSNNYNHSGTIIDASADSNWKTKVSLTAPYGTGNTTSPDWKFFFRWSALPQNLQLKAIALTGWQNDLDDSVFGAGLSPVIFKPQTLVVLPTSILIRGRQSGAQTPDVLEVSYFLSIVGA